jgi:hypothetical protein
MIKNSVKNGGKKDLETGGRGKRLMKEEGKLRVESGELRMSGCRDKACLVFSLFEVGRMRMQV